MHRTYDLFIQYDDSLLQTYSYIVGSRDILEDYNQSQIILYKICIYVLKSFEWVYKCIGFEIQPYD